MNKTKALAAIGISFLWLGSVAPAGAQGNAPIGHRQPNASEVPANDTYLGSINNNTAAPATKKRTRARASRARMDVILKTPNICSNCNQ